MKNFANMKMKSLTTVIAIASFATAVCAQGPMQQQTGTMKGAVIKGRAPVNKQILSVNLPKAQEATLKNGLRVMVLESHRVPTFSMEMVVMSGGLFDPSDMHGLAGAAATLPRQRTAKEKSRQLAAQTDKDGATVGGRLGPSALHADHTAAERG